MARGDLKGSCTGHHQRRQKPILAIGGKEKADWFGELSAIDSKPASNNRFKTSH
jgi:hypothetical protein